MDNSNYNFKEIEAKWQKEWAEKAIFSPDIDNAPNPYYNLMMFPYPSAEGLHVGNMYAFTGADVYARFNRMQGKDVLEPIGLDGFGIHSENYAMKVGRHPKEQAQLAEKNFYRQLHSIGNSFDWNRTIETYDSDYYKWTQWLFTLMFKNNLAYRKTALVNWCPKDMTVLSDEQVIAGECERCGTKVERRELEQWFFRITDYAEQLLGNIDKLDWPEKIKIAQRNWIGKSEGAEVDFEVEGIDRKLRIFTTRPDTLFGATFMVVAPEHELISSVLSSKLKVQSEKLVEIRNYVDEAQNKSDIERTAEGKVKTGVDTGLFAINPVNSKKIPIYVADYVLAGYGTGAIMAVPAHDQRDFEFAKRYDLPIVPVIKPVLKTAGPGELPSPSTSSLEAAGAQGDSLSAHHPDSNSQEDLPYEGDGIIIGSGEWNGFHGKSDMNKVLDWLEAKGLGPRKANYHLRDWLISRQRYWGPPIPMVYCSVCAKSNISWFNSDKFKDEREGMGISNVKFQMTNEKQESENWDKAGWFPVSEEDLPVKLPDVADWKPMGTGKAPLANHPEFYKTTCPNCGGEATRETDVSDTFLDSAWYFLRYPSTDIESEAFDTLRTRKWLPVNIYIGGAEHAVLHLLYSRFVTQVLNKLKLVDFEEPFPRLFAHGLIIKDGAKMSKSKGNVVIPDDYIAKYGSDTLRTYLMFLGPYKDGGDFRDSGIEGMNRFIRRVWRLFAEDCLAGERMTGEENELYSRIFHKTVKKVTHDVEELSYNTAIASLMELYNELTREPIQFIGKKQVETYLKLLAPFAPHMTEHLYQMLKNPKSEVLNSKQEEFESIHLSSWPEFDEELTKDNIVTIPVQINGKRRAEVEIESAKIKNQSEIEDLAKKAAEKHLKGQTIRKIIYVEGKILNIVI